VRALRYFAPVVTGLVLTACVTINIYFPEAAAEQAADRIIDDVWGNPGGADPAPESSSGWRINAARVVVAGAEWLIPTARAATANIDISTPAIDALTASMRSRHRTLAPFYTLGAVGQTADGMVAVRDLGAASVKDRKRVKDLVNAENRDRSALYREIARANGHPEWESDIRAIFARRWIERAAPGWWYQSEGGAWLTR